MFSLNNDLQDDPEVILINTLADEYYNFYIEYEYFPGFENNDYINDSLITESNLLKQSPVTKNLGAENFINASVTSYAVDSSIMKSLGYNYSNSQIAIHLAQLGAFLKLGFALEFLDLIAMIVGASVITLVVAVAFVAFALTIIDAVGVWYYNSITQTKESQRISAAVLVQRENGAEYWVAYLIDYKGLGGISIGDPVNFIVAQQIVRNDTSLTNIFTFDYGRARDLASSVSIGKSYTIHHEVHRDKGKILNCQHVHAYPYLNSSVPGNTHIFFATPVYY